MALPPIRQLVISQLTVSLWQRAEFVQIINWVASKVSLWGIHTGRTATMGRENPQAELLLLKLLYPAPASNTSALSAKVWLCPPHHMNTRNLWLFFFLVPCPLVCAMLSTPSARATSQGRSARSMQWLITSLARYGEEGTRELHKGSRKRTKAVDEKKKSVQIFGVPRGSRGAGNHEGRCWVEAMACGPDVAFVVANE